MLDLIINILLSFIGTYFVTLFFIYCWKNLNQKRNLLNFHDIIIATIISLITSVNMVIIQIYLIKILTNIFIFIIFNYLFYTRDIKKSITMTILLQLIVMLSEVIYAIICTVIFKFDVTSPVPYINLVNNIGTTIVSLLLWKTSYPRRIYNFIVNSIQSFKQREIIIATFLMLMVAIISTMAVYMNWNYIIVLSINTFLIFVFVFISIKFANAQSKYNEINNKYETSITSLREYEAMIDKYRIYNHENKNELQTLRNLISKKNTKALKYIDSILDNKIKDNEKIMHKTSKIPEGGLRATIYSKLCTMDELGIKYSLDIAKDIRTVDLINMKEDIVLNICKILGVFLDNAIEAVKDLKTKHIGIEIYLMDGDLCVDITNNYEGKLDMNKIGSSKYTTKGGNHGYGLSLVNQIISDYPDRFENEKSITKNTFTQKIKIKM